METYILGNDIRVFCVTAKSFPDGIMEAFGKLHASVSAGDKGRQFGISRPCIDPNGYCLEWYLNPKDVRCMVRLEDNKIL